MATNTSPQNKNKSDISGSTVPFKTHSVADQGNQIKMLDGNYTEKERRQVVMKLIQFMKAA